MASGDDRDRWTNQEAVEITGYVSEVKSGGDRVEPIAHAVEHLPFKRTQGFHRPSP